MRTLIAIVAWLALLGCGRPTSSLPPPTLPAMHRVPDAHLVFTPPAGWYPMLEESWRSRGFSAGFQKGRDPQIPSSYFLVQVKRQEKWPEKTLQFLAAKAAPLGSAEDLGAYISSGKYKSKPELYSAKHDMFLFVQEYQDGERQSITVMAKRFCQRHYVVFHFYLRDELEADVGVITSVLSSLCFDQDEKNRTTGSTVLPESVPSDGE